MISSDAISASIASKLSCIVLREIYRISSTAYQ